MLDRPEIAEGPEITAALGEQVPGSISFVGCDLNRLAEAESGGSPSWPATEGGIDVVVTNAALIINRPFEEFSIAEYEAQLRVNAAAAFAIVRGLALVHEGEALWAHRHVHVSDPQRPLGRICALRREQGRGPRPDTLARSRAWPLGHPRQRGVARSCGVRGREAGLRGQARGLQQLDPGKPEPEAADRAASASPASCCSRRRRPRLFGGRNIATDGGWSGYGRGAASEPASVELSRRPRAAC